jgi:hypothetical protein
VSWPWLRRLFGPDLAEDRGLVPRWIFLRGLGVIFLSVYLSLAYEIHGMIGTRGVLPAQELLRDVRDFVPTVLWLTSASDAALTALVVAGFAASVLLILNVAPRAMIAVCWVPFLSFIAVAQDFASYQSDGMLLEAGLFAFFLAPRGLRPGLGARHPPMPAARFLLLFEWFRIYFESGVAKLAGGDLQWRTLTAMDHYYENGPLPTWIGWYVQKLPHAFHAATCVMVFLLELGVVFLMFLPRRFRRWRIAAFAIVTPFQVGIIATANYAFLNYLVLLLGVLLLDDRLFRRTFAETEVVEPARWRMWGAAALLGWVFYAQVMMLHPRPGTLGSVLLWPVRVAGTFGVANQYGLFGSMTSERLEIEFQGTRDGETWVPYPFRFKPQDPTEPPGIYAPYQPRFEWNLWFASLEGTWRANPWITRVEALLLQQEPQILSLFRQDPFAGGPPPSAVRAVLWRYWFGEKMWWHRELVGPFAPAVRRGDDGKLTLDGER